MKRVLLLILSVLFALGVKAQDNGRDYGRKTGNNLDIKTQIDSIYVFGFDLTESRSAKGGIWNTKTGKPETPLNYTKAQKDTIDSVPVVKLYRQVALGNHPLNGWEIWRRENGKWICTDGNMPTE